MNGKVFYYIMETQKFDFFFQKSSKLNFDLVYADDLKSP